MNLKSFFSLIIGVLFQRNGHLLRNIYNNSSFGDAKESYDKVIFFCPKVFAVDGMNISLQIHHGNYCKSDKGYREFSQVWEEVEFGFPQGLKSESEALLAPYGESNGSDDIFLISDVGRVPIEILEKIFKLHGGIDWEKTCECKNLIGKE